MRRDSVDLQTRRGRLLMLAGVMSVASSIAAPVKHASLSLPIFQLIFVQELCMTICVLAAALAIRQPVRRRALTDGSVLVLTLSAGLLLLT